VAPEAAQARLAELLARSGLDEARPAQSAYAAAASYAFQPRAAEGAPAMMLAEAGTGVGKTLGYLAPASLWAEQNGPAVWISTYTRALQRQIERESASLFPDPAKRARRVVVRKGRENYTCLLNFQEMVGPALTGGGDLVGLALTARWLRATRDGDMTGGDYPAWLPGLFAVPPTQAAAPGNLVDRRGECVHAACPHYRACFVEKAIRGSRRADLVIANHALVMSHAAFDGARGPRAAKADVETTRIKRVVFDEGHHLFDAADSAFSSCLSGQEAAELRRWVRGPEARGRRGRGLDQRLGDLVAGREAAERALQDAVAAAAQLPGEGWSSRISPPEQSDWAGDPRPVGPVETFLAAVLAQLRARSDPSDLGQECAVRPVLAAVAEAAEGAARALALIEAPLVTLARTLEDLLDDEASELEGGDRARIEGALRGLDRRARMALPAWRAMLAAIADDDLEPDPDFVDWFAATFHAGRMADAATAATG
jgi:ATP-dependent DNA helicase DinG